MRSSYWVCWTSTTKNIHLFKTPRLDSFIHQWFISTIISWKNFHPSMHVFCQVTCLQLALLVMAKGINDANNTKQGSHLGLGKNKTPKAVSWIQQIGVRRSIQSGPRYIWLKCIVNEGRYSIHGAYGYGKTFTKNHQTWLFWAWSMRGWKFTKKNRKTLRSVCLVAILFQIGVACKKTEMLKNLWLWSNNTSNPFFPLWQVIDCLSFIADEWWQSELKRWKLGFTKDTWKE